MSQTIKLSDRQKEILCQFTMGNSLSISDISNFELSKKSSLATLKRDLSEMVSAGFLILEGEKRSSKYLLTS